MTTQVETMETNGAASPGNTMGTPNTQKTKRETQKVGWIFTYFTNGDDDPKLLPLKEWLKKYCKVALAEWETCPTTGRTHLQGYFLLHKRERFSALKQKLNFIPTIHIEAKRGSDKRNNKYCTKENRIWIMIPESLILEDDYLEETPYKYQEKIIKIINKKPDKRKIYWFWEKHGKMGKSTFTRHLILQNEDLMAVTGSSADIKYAIGEWITEHNPLKTAILDIPRCKKDYISYAAIEELKNGYFFSTKYKSKQVVFNRIHVICFANSPPEIHKLSKDRWKIYKIKKDGSYKKEDITEDVSMTL